MGSKKTFAWPAERWIAFASLGVSVIAIIITLCLAHKQSKIQDRLSAMNFEPRLELSAPPHIKSMLTQMAPISIAEMRKHPFKPDSIDTIELPFRVRITSQLFLKNTGNTVAKIFAFVQSDSTTPAPFIRSHLLQTNASDTSITVNQYEKPIDVAPGGSAVLTFDNDVSFIDTLRFTLHYLVLYENNLHNLYDTYVSAPFSLTSPQFEAQIFKPDSLYAMRLIYNKNLRTSDLVKPNEQANVTFWLYTEEQADHISQLFEELGHRTHKKSIANNRF